MQVRMSAGDWRGIIEAYRPWLPPVGTAVTLHEGNTPLLASPRLSAALGRPVWLKIEGSNPTGSFKDRGMTVAVSRAATDGARGVICASTGNTAASAAAYAARAGLRCVVVLPSGAVARGKLVQAIVHGAQIVAIDGGFDAALDLARSAATACGLVLVNSLNPLRLEGQMTAAFEICDALGGAPGTLVLPAGGGGNITSYWKGFSRYRDDGRTAARPRLIGVQAEGANPFVRGGPVDRPQTLASAIRIGRPANWGSARAAATESGGRFLQVSDARIAAAQQALGRDGIFVEPASAAAVAGAMALDPAELPDGDLVCVLTGHGLKDPDAVPAAELTPIAATLEALRAAIEGGARWG
jgi:threonine synthase